jgi:uncharacterized alkaline shock family protein YloU
MEDKVLKNDSAGEIRVGQEVISVIAGMAITEIPGVYSLIENIDDKAYSKKLITKGISIEHKGEEVLATLNLIIKYGFNIDEVCRDVQFKIKDALENTVGFNVKTVNVVVAGVQYE